VSSPNPNDVLIQLLMLDAGIVPFALGPMTRFSTDQGLLEMQIIDKRIASLPLQSRRQIKRKFRKLWRKAVRAQVQSRPYSSLSYNNLSPNAYSPERVISHNDIVRSTYGLGNPNPTARQKCARRAVVMWFLKKEISESSTKNS